MRSRIALPLGLVCLATIAFAAPSAHAAVTITSFTTETTNTLAGGHPDAGTSFAFRPTFGASGEPITPAGGIPRNLTFTLPQGLVGNALSTPRCSQSTFEAFECPVDTQVGAGNVIAVSQALNGEANLPLQVYDLVPGAGAPALFGIDVDLLQLDTLQLITASVHAANEYAVTLTLPEITRIDKGTVLASNVTLWGVPADPSHDGQRRCVQWSARSNVTESGCASDAPLRPFIESPTGCSIVPVTAFSVDTYQEPEVFSEALASSPIPTDCASVPFSPSIAIAPDTGQAGAPTGLNVSLSVPQNEAPGGQGASELEKAVVTLPQGMTISPSAASKLLEGCTNEQFAAKSDEPANCPPTSVIGEDEVETPLLSGPLKGKVYLGQPLSTEPLSGKMFRSFQELQGFGLDVKVEGSVIANPTTGQLTATFANLPELPFQTFRLHFNGGPNAVLVNPATCGPHTTSTQLYPYSNPTSPATPPSTFETSYDGGSCPAALPFAPSASISTATSQAGATSPLTVSFARGDGTQPLGEIDAKLPAGLLGYVSKVPLCEASAALDGNCVPESRVGTVATTAGAGEDPLTVQGSVYLARGSNGYPFMLSVVVPAVAGPYNLGNVVVPVWLQVNSDGSLTAVSGALPSILDGIPLDIRSVTMTIDRPGFTFNPTSCGALSLTGSATSLSGTPAPLSAPFQATGCSGLPFAPSFTVATQGSTSKANGASLTVLVSQKSGEADIHSVHVELPRQLPSRLTTLQKACGEAQFAADPAGCPKGSVVGTATAITPTLSSPLTGPAILVSHGGAAFPDLEAVLQGEGVTVILDGQTDIKKGITSSNFASVPDVPISGFELTLPEGPYALLGPNGTLCTSKLLIPTTIVGQNGTTVKQSTRIAVTGCPAAKPVVKVTKTKAKASSLLVTINTTAQGTVMISGSGLRSTAKKNVKAGTTQLVVPLTKGGRVMRLKHKQLQLHARLVVGKQAVAKTTTVKL